jgi:hypothetical protein
MLGTCTCLSICLAMLDDAWRCLISRFIVHNSDPFRDVLRCVLYDMLPREQIVNFDLKRSWNKLYREHFHLDQEICLTSTGKGQT